MSIAERNEARTIEPTGEVHPAADVFPMIPEDELEELAADIKQNGLRHPITLDPEGVLLDGRNRAVACRRVGVRPTYEVYEGDPIAFILSSNVTRRNLNQSQRAMAIARLSKLDKSRQTDLARGAQTRQSRVSEAGMVLRYAPELEELVMSGAISLSDAYTEAKARKEAQRSREEQAKRAETDLARLRAGAPDLAELVIEERMPLTEALAAWRQRAEEERREREDLTQSTAKALVNLWAVLAPGPERIAEQWVDGINRQTSYGDATAHLWTGDGLRALAAQLDTFAALVERRGGLQ